MDSRTEKIVWFGVSTAIFVGLIYFADLSKFLQAISTAAIPYLVPAFVAGFSVLLVLGFTWYRFMKKVGIDVSYLKALRLFLAGQFMNSITPLGQFGGEPFMAYIIRRNTDTSYEKAFSTVFSADIVNGIPMLTFVIGGSFFLLFFGSVSSLVLQTIYAAVFLTLLGGLLVYLLWFKAGFLEGYLLSALKFVTEVIGRGVSLVEKAEKRLEKVQESFALIGADPLYILETAVIAHLSFLLNVICLYFILMSMGISAEFVPMYFVIAISGLANFAPTPGGSGAYEATMAALISSPILIGAGFEFALAAAVLFRLSTYWAGLIVGYLSLLSIETGEDS